MNQCRICLEESNNLISPCKCRGSSKYVHFECLEHWRETTTNEEAKIKCMECNAPYIIKNKYRKENMFIDPKKNLVLKNHVLQFLLGLVIVFCNLAIDYSLKKPSLQILNYIYPTNITSLVEQNTINTMLYYNLYGFSFLYMSLFLFFAVVQLLFINQKYNYFKRIILMWTCCFLLSTNYIYYYLIFLFNQELYLYFGLTSPLLNIILLDLLVNKHNSIITYLNKNNVNIYLEYPEENDFITDEIPPVPSEPPPSPPSSYNGVLSNNEYYLQNPLFNSYSENQYIQSYQNSNQINRSVYPPIPHNLFIEQNEEEHFENNNGGFNNLMDELLTRSKNNTINLRKVERTRINLKNNNNYNTTNNYNAVIREFTIKCKK